jgi:hypothetical protein
MEQLLRVQNERDRRVLSWLRATFDDDAITAAAQGCAAPGVKPYLSTVCRALGVTPHRSVLPRHRSADVGERHLASIYQILKRSKPTAQLQLDSGCGEILGDR